MFQIARSSIKRQRRRSSRERSSADGVAVCCLVERGTVREVCVGEMWWGDVFVVDFWDGGWWDEEGGTAVALSSVFSLCGRKVGIVECHGWLFDLTIGLKQ
jgi:hypothetical protein